MQALTKKKKKKEKKNSFETGCGFLYAGLLCIHVQSKTTPKEQAPRGSL